MVKHAAYLVAAYVCLSDEASKHILCFVSDLCLACISPFRLQILQKIKDNQTRSLIISKSGYERRLAEPMSQFFTSCKLNFLYISKSIAKNDHQTRSSIISIPENEKWQMGTRSDAGRYYDPEPKLPPQITIEPR